jgi:hypothetical protein
MARRSSLVLQRRRVTLLCPPSCGREQWTSESDDSARTAMEHANFIH